MQQERQHGNAESFSRKSGTLMSKQFLPIGEVKSVKIQVVQYKDLINENKEQAIRFEYEYYDSYLDQTETKLGSLDKDELEGLIKSINIMRTVVFNSFPEHYTEVGFVSRNGFKAGCYSMPGDWKFYLQLDQYDDRSYIWLTKEDSATILNILDQSNERLLMLGNNVD
ncbi:MULTISPECIES: hypothetical protein [Sphingobacterium]|uniref:hypothetical protein n=1 Tax=Sphingobacterium TaxID=28453 RepID=UPI002579F7A3|nr:MULTISPECIES: hypothetical protein [Sphingobacterium]